MTAITWTRAAEAKLPFGNNRRGLAFSPAVTNHDGNLFFLWQHEPDNDGLLWGYMEQERVVKVSRRFNNGNVRCSAPPSLVDVVGILHAITPENNMDLSHWQLANPGVVPGPAYAPAWVKRKVIGMASTLGPAVLDLRDGRILCVGESESKATADDQVSLCWSIWQPGVVEVPEEEKPNPPAHQDTSFWSVPLPVAVNGVTIQTHHRPSLAFVGHDIHLFYVRQAPQQGRLSFAELMFDPVTTVWVEIPVATELAAAQPVGGCDGMGLLVHQMGFLAFKDVDNAPNPSFPNLPPLGVMSIYHFKTSPNGTTWQSREAGLPDLRTRHTPILATLRGSVYCFFTTTVGTLDYFWRSVEAPSSSWMSSLMDITPITELNIPGTHDSVSIFDHALPPWDFAPWVETQKLTITQQLEFGVRFLDLRMKLDERDRLWMVHKWAPLGLRFDAVVDELDTFLSGNPTETVIVTIKNDGEKPENILSFGLAIQNIILQKPNLWYLHVDVKGLPPTPPTLALCRSRIVLIKRFPAPNIITSLDLSIFPEWPNRTSATLPTAVIQDRWNFMKSPLFSEQNIQTKWEAVSQLLELARADLTPGKLYLNFLSATSLLWPWQAAMNIATGRWNATKEAGQPPRYSNTVGINQKMLGFLVDCAERGEKVGRIGILIMDYPQIPDLDLVSAIISSNF